MVIVCGCCRGLGNKLSPISLATITYPHHTESLLLKQIRTLSHDPI